MSIWGDGRYGELSNTCLELSPEAIHYLTALFESVAKRQGTPNALSVTGLNQVFATAPNGNPWSPALWRSAVKTTKDQGTRDSSMLTLDGFISMWWCVFVASATGVCVPGYSME